MTKLRGRSPENAEVWTQRGELRNPADRSDQPGQAAPERSLGRADGRADAPAPASGRGRDDGRKTTSDRPTAERTAKRAGRPDD